MDAISCDEYLVAVCMYICASLWEGGCGDRFDTYVSKDVLKRKRKKKAKFFNLKMGHICCTNV